MRAAIEKGKIAPVYVLLGDEPGPIRELLAVLRKAVLPEGMEAFNHERFAGRDLEGIGPVLEACAQLPVMSKRRLVELDDPEAVGKAASGKQNPNVEGLVAYLKDPNPTSVLVLVSSGLDARSKIVNAAKKAGVVHRFAQIKRDRDAVDFVAAAAAERGMKLGRDAAEELVALCGTGQSALLAALERADLHAGPGGHIAVQDVAAVAAHTRDAVIFDLTDAVGLGQHERALKVLAHLFTETPNSEIGQSQAVMAMLIRQFRLLFLAHGVGAVASRIESVGGVHPFVARKLAQQARRLDEAKLRRSYAALTQLDRDLKGGAYSVVRTPYAALQRFVLDACGATSSVAPRI